MLSVIMLSVIMLSVFMLSVLAPWKSSSKADLIQYFTQVNQGLAWEPLHFIFFLTYYFAKKA